MKKYLEKVCNFIVCAYKVHVDYVWMIKMALEHLCERSEFFDLQIQCNILIKWSLILQLKRFCIIINIHVK